MLHNFLKISNFINKFFELFKKFKNIKILSKKKRKNANESPMTLFNYLIIFKYSKLNGVKKKFKKKIYFTSPVLSNQISIMII